MLRTVLTRLLVLILGALALGLPVSAAHADEICLHDNPVTGAPLCVYITV